MRPVCVVRQDWGILRPLISNDPEHIEDLLTSGVFIAGCTDPTLVSRLSDSSLFDVVYHTADRRVIVSDWAAADMRMGAAHRDLSQVHLAITAHMTVTSLS